MKTNCMSPVRMAVCTVALSFLAGSSALVAQEQPAGPPPADNQQQSAPADGQWRKANDPAPAQSTQATPPVQGTPAPEPAPRTTMDPNYSQGAPPATYPNQYPNQQYPSQQYPSQPYPSQPYPGQRYGSQSPPVNYNRGPIPAKLTIKPGTYITVRLNQGLSSDRNKVGDGFAATLAKPVVVDGVVVADRGQTVGGKVTEAKKAGRVEGVSHLAVQLTDLTLSDGLPVPIQTQLFSKNGSTSVGRDVGAVGATTATGAMVGAAAGWGTGAAIGAGAGAFVGILGVLVTRGRPTYLYPEQILTFRVEAPVTVSTETAPQAFRWVNPNDYERPYDVQNRTRPPNGAYYGYNYPYPYAYPYPYSYMYGYPYYWGPGIGFYWGRGWGRGWGRWR